MTQAAWPVFAGIEFERGRLFDTDDVEEARERTARVFNPHALRVIGAGQRLRARMDHLPMGPMSLNRLGWGAAVSVDPDRLDSYYLLSLPVRGRAVFELAGKPVELTPSRPALVNAAQRFRITTTEDFDQIVLRFERGALEAAWQALSGAPVSGPIDFAPSLPRGGPAWRAIEPTLALAAHRVRGSAPVAGAAHVDARLQEMLLTMLLLTQPHSQAGAAAPSHRPPPALLRRAEGWMREHLAEPLTVGAVALACGTSVRTLQAVFRDTHGLGPMQWLRAERLQAVRDALRAGRPGETVSAAALRHGFGHLGEFSQAYRRAFGEPPSRTLHDAG